MISKAFANQINQKILGGVDMTPIATWYFGLSTSPITDGTIPTNGEPTNAGYSRTAIANTQANFSTPTFSEEYPLSYITNKTNITMTEITGGEETTVPYFFLSTSSTSKTCQIWGEFTNPRKIMTDSQLIIKAGGAVFEIENI